MSSGAAGKFQDHYVLLGVETNADSETIQAAYTRLAQKFHPSNTETGDKTKFEALNQAYEVLADPALRIEFDKVKGVDHESGNPKFSGAEFFDALAEAAALRSAILCILHDRRRVKSLRPSLSLRHLEAMLNVTHEEMNFALWYIKQRGFAVNDDKSSMAITVEGISYLEQNRPALDEVIKFIKPESLLTPVAKAPTQAEKTAAADARAAEPVLNALSRALQRHSPQEEYQRVPLRSK
ncbi:MAG TPA: DnaJ domain-containing protein [Bryobacteraceae bacterium]|jgi:curved DNA-binding protein CbpA|nr:DnaJ domain-containing protein [Bryobacteraceae bacterium]